MKKILCLLSVILITSCGIFKKKNEAKNEKAKVEKEPSGRSFVKNINVEAKKLDKLTIGKTLGELDLKKWQKFDKTQVDASFFGFDGGGRVSLYSFKNQPIAAILKRESQKINTIIAIHPDIKTKENISVRSSLNKIKATYPDGKLKDDQMNKWSIYEIPAKSWQFIFDARLDEISGDERSQFLIIR